MPSALSTGEMPISPAGVDFLLTPATLSTAPRLDDLEQNVESWSQDQLLVPASLAGLPAMVVPVKCPKPTAAKPWPVGVQIIGQWGAEPMLFHLGSCSSRLGHEQPQRMPTP
ncbi:Trimeric GatFAB AmidoTransferase(AdT) complex subunit [Puccinia graminis f. sp. tritici]|uniref:Trimeric GatFAB AmidoTransferase(AdT) complex subunit n=1 Tax=Puccinia graminis f. sp. tritici TaxID=56615 RepID=A0A5B0PMA4_PUCGR|nr:Trimeric GatFAB AmidoTransferase(AdT) complex subunit [Puccinia graminis f. sp. tritici]